MTAELGWGVRWRAIAQIATSILRTLASMLMGRSLGPSFYGGLRVISIVTRVFRCFQFAGPASALAYFTAHGHCPRVLQKRFAPAQFAIAAVLCAVTFLNAARLADFFHMHALRPYIQATALLALVLAWEPTYLGPLGGLLAFREQAVARLCAGLAQLLVLAALLAAGWGLAAWLAGLFAAGLVQIAVGRWCMARRTSVTSVAPPEPARWSRIASFAAGETAAELGFLTLGVLGFIWVKASYADPKIAGQFAAGLAIAGLLDYFFVAFNSTLFPMIAQRLEAGDLSGARELLSDYARASALLVLPLVFLAAAAAPGFIRLFFGQAYSGAAQALGFLVVGGAAYSVFMSTGTILSACGSPQLASILAWVAVAAQGALLAFFVPRYGVPGAVAAYGLSSLLGAAAALGQIHLHLRCGGQQWPWTLALVAAALSCCAGSVVLRSPFSVASRIAASALAYGACLWVLWLFLSTEEKLRMRRLAESFLGI